MLHISELRCENIPLEAKTFGPTTMLLLSQSNPRSYNAMMGYNRFKNTLKLSARQSKKKLGIQMLAVNAGSVWDPHPHRITKNTEHT